MFFVIIALVLRQSRFSLHRKKQRDAMPLTADFLTLTQLVDSLSLLTFRGNQDRFAHAVTTSYLLER